MVASTGGRGPGPARRAGHGRLDLRGDLPVEQSAGTLAIVACVSFAARLLRAGARRADADADATSRRLAVAACKGPRGTSRQRAAIAGAHPSDALGAIQAPSAGLLYVQGQRSALR
jgi:hypothetical protein